MGFRDYVDNIKKQAPKSDNSVGFRKYAQQIRNQSAVNSFKSTVHSEEEHDAVMRHMYGSYSQYIAQQIEENTSLSDDAKANLISYYGITESDTNRKKAQSQGAGGASTSQEAFRSLVRGVNDGSIKVSANFTGNDVKMWEENVTNLGEQFFNYVNSGGYETTEKEILTKIEDCLTKASSVGQYIRANKLNYEDYDATYQSYVETTNYLRTLKTELEKSKLLKQNIDSKRKAYEEAEDYNIVEKFFSSVTGNNTVSAEKQTAKFNYDKAVEEYYGNKDEQRNLLNYLILNKDQFKTVEQQEEVAKTIKTLQKSLYGQSMVDDQIVSSVNAASGTFNSNFTALLDVTLGNVFKLFGWKDNPISNFNKDTQNYANYWGSKSSEVALAYGDKYNLTGGAIQVVLGALPDAILAFMTMGASKLATASTITLKAISRFQTTQQSLKGFSKLANGTISAVRNTMNAAIKNPLYWSSFSRTLGNDYAEAKEKGADEATAYLYAILTSSINALVEVGGGVQELPAALKNKSRAQVLEYVKSTLEEGGEEIIQGLISEINEKLLYDHNKEVFSLTDMDAVVNPTRIMVEGVTGTVAGTVLGGGQVVANTLLNPTSQYKKIGKLVRNNVNVQDIVSYASKSLNDDIRSLATETSADKISDRDLGILYNYVVRDIDTAFNSVSDIEGINKVLAEFADGNESLTINQMVFSRFVNRLETLYNVATSGTPESRSSIQVAGDAARAEMGTSARDVASQASRGILSAISAANPKSDIMEEMKHKSAGVPWETDDQKLLRKIGRLFGAKVEFEDLDYTNEGELVSPEGDYDPDTNTIMLNTNVKDYHRSVQFILKHELTHSLERAGVDYEQFMAEVEASDEFEAYVKQRGFESADKWYEDIIDRYAKNGKPLGNETESAETAAKKEAVADFVADILFDGRAMSLENLLNSLQPDTRKGVIECIKEFFAKLKELFVGRPELTEIEQLEQRFLEVANKVKEMNAAEAEQQKTTTEDGSGGRYSIVTLDSGKSYVKASRRVITGNTVAEQRKEITDFFNEALKNGPIEIETDEGDVLTISKETADKARDINITENGVTRKLSKNEFLVKLHAEAHIDELTEISTKIKKPIAPDTKNHDFAKDGWTYRSVYFQDFDDSYYKITLSVGENNGVSTVYNVGKIKAENIPNGNIVSAIGSKADMSSARHSIPENGQPVNNNYAQSGTRYSFAGPKALTVNQENLSEAEKREKSRKKSERDSENIRRELGWFRGLDRMWRYEIDDSKAKFALPRFEDIDELIGKTGVTLGDCLKHDELFAAYPELRDISIEFVTSEQIDDYAATYNPNINAVSVNVDTISFWKSFLPKDLFDTELLGTIIHETQHAIQKIEGFASGANIAYWESVRASIARLENAIKSKENEIADNYGKDMLQLAKRYVALFEGVYDRKAVPAEFKKEKRAIEKTADEHKCGGLIRILLNHHLELRRNECKLASYTHAEDLYRDTGGEIEAENVRKRLRMDSDAREEARPDIDRENVVFVEDEFYNFGKKRDTKVKSAKNNYEVVAQRAKTNGYSEKLYHQTGNDFTVFDTEHQKAGKYDPEMPTGTFLKPDDSDIGLSGKKQMELFTKIKNPLEFRDRADAQRFWMRNIEGYAEALRAIDRINERYSREVARAGMDLSEYKKDWRRNNPDADSREIYNDAEFQRLDKAQELIAEEWESRSNEVSLEAKKLIDGYMLDSGYDGVVVESDQGSNGRATKTYVVFDSSQMKSTDTVTYDDNGNEIPVSARFDSSKKDIRYSFPERNVETYSEEQYNNFGWVRANNVLTAAEYSALMSNYTGHKHNNDNFPITRFGETVVHSNQCPKVLIYVKGNIRSPQITQVVKIDEDNAYILNNIKEELLKLERAQTISPFSFIRDIYGETVLGIDRLRDNASFQEYKRRGKRSVGEKDDITDRILQDRKGSASENTRTNRLSYSLPEKPTAEQIGNAYKNGEITREEYVDRINELWEETGKAEGTIKPGEIVEPPNKRVPTPKSVSDGTKVREFARTILESGYATPEMEAYLKELVLEGDFSYTPTSNEKTLEKARKNIESQGYGNAKDNWQKAIARSDTGADAVATGEALLKLALEHNDAVEAVNIAADLAEFGTRTAQSLQAFSLLKRMGGLGQLVYIQRTVNKLNEDLKKRFKKNTPVVKIDPKLADLLAKAETNGEYDVFYAKIMQDIAAQVPPTFLDKWNAWRYMSMLFNPTTHIRNLTGNGIFLPAVRMKDLVALGMEQFVTEDKRTKVLKVNKEYQQFAEKDFEEVKDIITGSGKYNPSDAVSEYRRIFKNKVLENARKLNFDLLEKEDIIFLKAHYRHALGSFLQAQKVDIDNISTAQLVKAREYAINEALKATYRDASKVANMMSQLSKINRGANIILEGVLPFKKTPINIMKRGLEYSPIGLVKTLSKGLYDLKTEKITVSQFIDGLAAGTVGAGVFLLGALLSSIGVAKGGFDDDEEWFKKLNGEQEYSIEIGGKSYTVDWAAPSSIPFFMGVAISEYNADEDADILSMLYDFGMAGFEPIMSLSMLSGIEDVISSVSYAEDGQKLTTLVGTSFKSYFSQALPTIFGKVSNLLDDTRRTSYVDKTSSVPEIVQQALDKIASKTPFVSKTRAEYIDAWGETKYTGNFLQRFFQQFVSPGYASTVNVTDVSEEISRLYSITGESGVYPSTPRKYVQFKGIRKDLSKEEYYKYATFKGQTQADLINEAVHSQGYKKLTDEQKAEVIKDIYSYAAVLAKCQLDYSYEEISTMVGEDTKGNPILSKEKYNRLDDKARRLLVNEYFTESGNVVRAYKTAKNGGSVVEYFVKKVKED